MKKPLIILILFFLSIQTYGQVSNKNKSKKKDDFIKQTEQINALLKYYQTLSPFSDTENNFELIDSLSNEITIHLLKVLNDKRILNYQIETLFTEEELMLSKSDDNRIYFFSIDEKTGGSYRTSKTIIHYRLSNGTVKAELFSGEASEALATSTYGQIYLLDSLTQKYFVIGGVQVCNTCKVLLALTIQLDKNSINTELIAKYDGRYYDLKVFDYDSTVKEFNYEFYAAENDDSLYGGDNEKTGLKHRYKSKFKYINAKFSEIENFEFWDEKE
ncbi:MAG: hypothetical protein LC115_07180 [Bacteroidia bacterium]|nr:hypothetical protein [Bacteroidia bacterium]